MIWQDPPDPPRLTEDAAHVWLLSLRRTVTAQHRAILSSAERDHAARFRFPYLEQAYIIAHSALRMLLGQYGECAREQIRFEHNAYGKPSLPASEIEFNLSHSGDYALIAFTLETHIGVDIEVMKPLDDVARIAARVFSANERAVLDGLPTSKRMEGFYNCWTRKEAYIKAIGKGLAQPLDAFDVSLRPGDHPALLRVDDMVEPASSWRMLTLPAPKGYAAALAIERQHVDLHCWRYTDH